MEFSGKKKKEFWSKVQQKQTKNISRTQNRKQNQNNTPRKPL